MKYNNEIIILIEYYNNIPFSVLTEFSVYDFELYNNNWLMFYCSGGGKNFRKINGEKIIEFNTDPDKPELWKIWVDSNYKISGKLNIKFIKNPIMLSCYHNEKEKHNNPFIVGEAVNDIKYCDKCLVFYDEDGCPKHEEL